MENLLVMNRLLSQPDASIRHKDAILNAMINFTQHFADPNLKMGRSKEQDNMKPLLSMMREEHLSVDLEIMTSKMIKILLRKPQNRTSIGRQGVASIIKALIRQTERPNAAAAEIGNVILNTCYDGDNVQTFLDEGGMKPLLQLLYARDPNVQASALGALQGICFVSAGRQSILHEEEALQIIAYFLNSDHPLVRARATGAIHNISTDPVFIRILREINSIPSLVSLLTDSSVEVCQAAAGALQNMSREVSARELIMSSGAIPPLCDLLFGNDILCQVAALGALLNTLSSPNLDAEDVSDLRNLLSDALVVGALKSCLFDTTTTTTTSIDSAVNRDTSLAVQDVTF